MPLPPRLARRLARRLLKPEDQERVSTLRVQDAGHGYDAFGMHPDYVGLGLGLAAPVYDRYFRVLSYGSEHIPRSGPVIVAANHSGTVPTDGMMLWTDLLRRTGRVPRAVADHFVPTLPFVGLLFARGGVVGGSRGNARALLEAGELLMIFPEGTPGVGKHYRQAYQLQSWRVGHAELAIRHGAAVVPAAIVGAEEQMPQVGRLERVGRALGLPYLPVPATPLPLPVRYRILYGAPIRFPELPPQAADDPDRVAQAAGRVEEAVKELLAQGLKLRGGRLFT